jgi:hypothetical protein
VTGTYAGGDARSIRFIVGDQVKVFPVSDVVSVQFDNPTAKQPSSSEGLRTPSEPVPPSTPDVADKQRKFCAVIEDYRDANTRYANEPNPNFCDLNHRLATFGSIVWPRAACKSFRFEPRCWLHLEAGSIA